VRVSVDRPHIQLLTAQLRELVEEKAHDFDVLHGVFVELLFRERRAARELRKVVGDRLSVLEIGYFQWPTTEAPEGPGQLDDSYFQYQQGLLGFIGYRVGASGVGATQRQDLLDSVYLGPLPLLNSKDYMAEWGHPSTGNRLKKIAESIAAFARNAKRRDDQRMSTAIAEWEADLNYLKATYYVSRYQFPWPETAA
jgi:hypothetical protein